MALVEELFHNTLLAALEDMLMEFVHLSDQLVE